MTIEQLRIGLMSDSTIFGIVDKRIYERLPLEAPTDSYLSISRNEKTIQMVGEANVIQVFAFAKLYSTLETLSEAVIDYLQDNKIIGSDTFFKVEFINQSDFDQKLRNGFYYNVLNFRFKETK